MAQAEVLLIKRQPEIRLRSQAKYPVIGKSRLFIKLYYIMPS